MEHPRRANALFGAGVVVVVPRAVGGEVCGVFKESARTQRRIKEEKLTDETGWRRRVRDDK